MNKTGAILLGLGAVGLAVGIYLNSKSKKNEGTLKASGMRARTVTGRVVKPYGKSVDQGQGGFFVRCADGSTSRIYSTYEQAVANVDTHCASRGGGGVMSSTSSILRRRKKTTPRPRI
jgi:hypothetical protein